MELSDACIIAVRSLSDLAMALPIACFGNVRRAEGSEASAHVRWIGWTGK